MTPTTSHTQFLTKGKLTNFVIFSRSDDPDIEFHRLYYRCYIFSQHKSQGTFGNLTLQVIGLKSRLIFGEISCHA